MANRGISKLFTRPTLAVVLRYGLAVLLVGIALAITLITRLHNSPPRFVSHFVLLAIAITFWFAGTGPGLLAFLLSCLGVSLFAKNNILLPGFPLWPFLSFFAIFSLLMGWFAASRRRAQKQLTEARDTLELRVAERTNELQRSEKELRELIDTIPATVWIALPDGSNVYVNRRFIEYSGMSAEQAAGSGWQAVTHPDDLQQHVGKWMESTATGKPHENEVRFRHLDGQYRWHLNRGVPLRDEDGKIIKWYGALTDIEDRKRAEEALQLMSRDLVESKSRLEEAERVAHVGYWEWDFATDRVIWSDETYRIHGLHPQERPIDLATVRELVHPEDRDFVFRTAEEAIRGGGRPDVEHRIVRPSGEVRVIHSEGDLRRDASGRPYQMFGVSQDITDRKRAEEALRRSEAYLAEAQRVSHTGSWVWNVADRSTIHVSEEWYRLYDLDPSDGPLTWEKRTERIHPEDQLKWEGVIERAILEKADFEQDFRIVLPGGIVRWIHTVGHPVLTAAGALVQFIGSSTDITERKRAEEERERLHQLEADLAHINRINMMGELAASLAHEIKQPIAAAITSASACLRWLAHDPPDLGRARAAAIRIEQDGNRASDVISHLRSFYKKDTPPEREMVDVNELVREMVALLRNETVRYSISIHFEVGADMPKILADRVQLQQVFMNLMLNAIEAMKDKGGELTITSRLNQEGQPMISVGDTGVGLPPKGTDRIFDAFYTTKPQGTGMGLAITRSIVESHGGRVWVTANEGAGATFHFTLRNEAGAHI